MRIIRIIKRKKILRLLKKRNIIYGSNLIINGNILLSDTINLQIGDNVKINSGFINPVGNEVCTSFSTVDNARINIGNNVGMSNATLYARAGINIEDDVIIGGGCRIYDTDFHPIPYEYRVKNLKQEIVSKVVTVKKGAFIGAHTVILKGVEIGEKSVIGAGSVVTKSIPAGEIWAGNPARFIRKIQ